ncbi:MAG: phosphoribosylamine--glycine ligase [Elusimicrobia bacterium]|nr:phosphoribosylamine--glycine ligase [Elusimicrobiota bacterium]
MVRSGSWRVLLLGAGGREHALAWKLYSSPSLGRLFCAPGSDAMDGLAERVKVDMLDPAAVLAFCREKGVDLVVVGPEAPLEAGVADGLRAGRVRVFGPDKDAARLETSKSFAKDFMARHRIPTAKHQVFSDAALAKAALRSSRFPLVVKADGLAQGKGVRVCADSAEASAAVTDFMEKRMLGDAGGTVVFEERLKGPELSVMALVDGRTYKLLPFARDHKRLSDGDAGPNTGGMGAFSPVPVAPALARKIENEVLARAVEGLRKDGLDYRGVLYAGLMLTSDGPKTLEFNCRFGDPEAQAVLPLVEEDLLELFLACAGANLSPGPVKTSGKSCVCVVLASPGYPEKPQTDRPITGLELLRDSGLKVFHSGTARSAGRWVTKGGRVMGVTALEGDFAAARLKAYAAVDGIKFKGMQFRKDIGASKPRAVPAKKPAPTGKR